MSTELVVTLIVAALAPGGCAWVGVKVGLNGIRKDIDRMETSLERLIVSDRAQGERLARIETRHELSD